MFLQERETQTEIQGSYFKNNALVFEKNVIVTLYWFGCNGNMPPLYYNTEIHFISCCCGVRVTF